MINYPIKRKKYKKSKTKSRSTIQKVLVPGDPNYFEDGGGSFNTSIDSHASSSKLKNEKPKERF